MYSVAVAGKKSRKWMVGQSIAFFAGLLLILVLRAGIGLYTAMEYGLFGLLYSSTMSEILQTAFFPAAIATMRFIQIRQTWGWETVAVFSWLVLSTVSSGLYAFYYFDGQQPSQILQSVWLSETVIAILLYASFTLITYAVAGIAAKKHSPKSILILLGIPLLVLPVSLSIAGVS